MRPHKRRRVQQGAKVDQIARFRAMQQRPDLVGEDLLWRVHEDADRAYPYFDRRLGDSDRLGHEIDDHAVSASPCLHLDERRAAPQYRHHDSCCREKTLRVARLLDQDPLAMPEEIEISRRTVSQVKAGERAAASKRPAWHDGCQDLQHARLQRGEPADHGMTCHERRSQRQNDSAVPRSRSRSGQSSAMLANDTNSKTSSGFAWRISFAIR
jgi:hypothetical protein